MQRKMSKQQEEAGKQMAVSEPECVLPTLFILLLCLLQLLRGFLLLNLQLQSQVVNLLLLSSRLFRMRLLHVRDARLQSCDNVSELRLLSSQFDGRVSQHLLHRRSLGRILLQHLHNEEAKLGGIE